METYQYVPWRETVTLLTVPTISRCMTISTHPAFGRKILSFSIFSCAGSG